MKKDKKTNKKIPHNHRHNFFYRLLVPLVKVFLKIKFKFKYKKATNLPDNYIVLSNHTTDFDMLFVACSFRKPMYFVASEHITRWKKTYRLLKYCFDPIMRYKGSVASSTVMEVLRRTRKGANVCIFAEGVRSWDGSNSPILPSTAKLIKSSGVGLVTYKLTGGYFVSPNWSTSKTRKGPIYGSPINVYTKEQLATMSEEEVYNIITTDLYENAYETQSKFPRRYTGEKLAEGLENLLFVCPKCNKYDSFTTHDDILECKECGLKIKYNVYGMLENSPYDTVYDFSQWQNKIVEKDVKSLVKYTSPDVSISTIDKHIKTPLTKGELIMSDKIKCNDFELPLEKITDISIYGKHGIVFTAGGVYYELYIPQNARKFQLYCLEYLKQHNLGR